MPKKKHGYGTIIKPNAKTRNYGIRYYVDGERKEKSLKVTTLAEARVQQRLFIDNLNAIKNEGEFVDKIAKDRGISEEKILSIKKSVKIAESEYIPLIDAFDRYISLPSTPSADAPSSIYNRRYWNRFAEWDKVKGLNLHEVDTKLANDFSVHLFGEEDGLKPQTWNKAIQLYKSVYDKLKHTAKLSENPFEHIDYVKKSEIKRDAKRQITTAEAYKLFDCAIDGEWRLLFALGWYTGLRLKDCVLLEWDSIDLTNLRITVQPFKTLKHNIVVHPAIIPPLYNEFKSYGFEQDSKYVLPNLSAKYLSHNTNLNKRIMKAFKDAKICSNEKGSIGFGSLRHSFISRLTNMGVNPQVVRDLVGHQSAEIAQTYIDLDHNVLRSAMMNLVEDKKQEKSVQDILSLVKTMTADNWEQIKKELLKGG